MRLFCGHAKFSLSSLARRKFDCPRINFAARLSCLGPKPRGGVLDRKALQRRWPSLASTSSWTGGWSLPADPTEDDNIRLWAAPRPQQGMPALVDSPRRTVSKCLVSSRAIAASREPSTAAKSPRVPRRGGQTRRTPEFREWRQARRYGSASRRFSGAKILQRKNRSVGRPATTKAASTADAPGTETTSIFCARASLTSLKPGSEYQRVPASETKASAAPAASRARRCGRNDRGIMLVISDKRRRYAIMR